MGAPEYATTSMSGFPVASHSIRNLVHTLGIGVVPKLDPTILRLSARNAH